MAMKTKSFRYSPEEHPKVERWIESTQKMNMNFSQAIRQLIENSEIEKEEIRKEIETLQRQINTLRNTGSRAEPLAQIEPEPNHEDKAEDVKVDTSFIRNRYFS